MPIIELENLTKSYKTKNFEITALNNISLKVEKKDIFGIIGLSGAGKSTLIRCINLLEHPNSGKVFFEGNDLTTLKNKDLLKARQNIGMIFQSFNLLDQRTVLKNVLFPLEISKTKKDVALKRALELLDLVGLKDRIDSYPHQLSGGQKQRVSIARALANNPSVLLCDEATSALDPNTTESILNLLKDINEKLGITIIIVTHEMSVIERICNKVAIVDESEIKEVGYVKDIFINPKTKIARDLILPKSQMLKDKLGNRHLRLILEGNELSPVIAEMVLKTQVLVNIIQANLKTVDNKAYGEMIIQLPDNDLQIEKIKKYLVDTNISFQENEYDN